jgi:hypothetical protein
MGGDVRCTVVVHTQHMRTVETCRVWWGVWAARIGGYSIKHAMMRCVDAPVVLC